MLTNTLLGTQPMIVHAQGQQDASPHWSEIRDGFFKSQPQTCSPDPRLTVITWSNDTSGPCIFEQSLNHLGLVPSVLGRGVEEWVNSIHKPTLTLKALQTISSDYVLGVDGFDAIALRDPGQAVDLFEAEFSCDLLFNAGKVCWPDLDVFRDFEHSVSDAAGSPFRYLNGGAWIGRTEFCREFFAAVAAQPQLDGWPGSEQGLLKQLFPEWYPNVSVDYRCRIFQTLQYVFDPIFRLDNRCAEI
ncbi:glycosyltransferase domain-containing protein [uncultured Tateyamaria sp.]|uniref:glycosyltransferase domain-containing protein n=1 Tax=uncultured Tateyamaria sp. TaxID=455651 RepID=UPI00260C60F7|nr:glycosyltransferase domain-containing protein [uncultured Tateyamaria sp.]